MYFIVGLINNIAHMELDKILCNSKACLLKKGDRGFAEEQRELHGVMLCSSVWVYRLELKNFLANNFTSGFLYVSIAK